MLYFGEIKKFKSYSQSEVSDEKTGENVLGSVRLWVTAVIPLVYYRLNKCLLNSISIVLLLKYIFPVLFFYLSKILRQYFSFYLGKIFRQYFYLYLSESALTSTLVKIELLLLTFT